MPNIQKHFFLQHRAQQTQNKNKQNNLSFRNIAATNLHNQSQVNLKPYTNNNLKVDKSFRSICANQSNSSFYTSGEDLQEELNYVGSCFNHSNKLAEFLETVSQKQYCTLCAAKLASLGYTIERSKNFVSRDISPSISRLKSRQEIKKLTQPVDISQSKISPYASINIIPPVKFSSIITQKNRTECIELKYEQNEQIINEYEQMYSEKMEKIEDIINDIRIKDTLYIKKLKSQNRTIYEQAKTTQSQAQRFSLDIYGKSIFRENSSHDTEIKFKLPNQQSIERLGNIFKFIEETATQQRPLSVNQIPLIKSVNSIQSNGNGIRDGNKSTQNILLKNSSSVSNISSKTNFKKQKKQHENKEKFNSEINHTKTFKQEEQIESSRFSSNSNIIRKKSHNHQPMTESIVFKRINTEMSMGGSSSCQDTPQSIKSKISGNSFVLPRNAAVAMFDKINVCESIDIKPEEIIQTIRPLSLENEDNKKSVNCLIYRQTESRSGQSNLGYDQSGNSSYKSDNQSASVQGKSRKSFNRYHNANNQL